MDRQSTMRSSRDVVQTSLLQLLNLVIDTCRVKGHIWTQQHYIQWSIAKSHRLLSLLFHTLMMVRLSYSTLTRWFTHLTSWFKHQISTIGHHTLSQNCPDWLCSKSPTDASSILAQDLQYALKTFTGKALLTGSSSTHHSDSHRGCISDVDNGENHYGDIQLHLVYCPWHLQCFPLTSNDKWFYA